MNDLRPVVVILNDNHSGKQMSGYFHKWTQGNMANDAIIFEDKIGIIHIYDMYKDVDTVIFEDREK